MIAVPRYTVDKLRDMSNQDMPKMAAKEKSITPNQKSTSAPKSEHALNKPPKAEILNFFDDEATGEAKPSLQDGFAKFRKEKAKLARMEMRNQQAASKRRTDPAAMQALRHKFIDQCFKVPYALGSHFTPAEMCTSVPRRAIPPQISRGRRV